MTELQRKNEYHELRNTKKLIGQRLMQDIEF